MKGYIRRLAFCAVIIGLIPLFSGTFQADAAALTIPLPPAGSLYHGVFPGSLIGSENDITLANLKAYETAVGKPAAWVFFSHDWFVSRDFPEETVGWIHEHGSIPYIRLMMRSSTVQNQAEPLFTLPAIIQGRFDKDLRAWCSSAAMSDYPLLTEFGTEMNGEWFPWNGVWNGGGKMAGYGNPREPDGPERFRDAYRHIITTCRHEGAENITWVFHVNGNDYPDEEWNHLENYYPGDDYIGWLALSQYGALTPHQEERIDFMPPFQRVYDRLVSLAPEKPVIVAEFGSTAGAVSVDQAEWAQAAINAIKAKAAEENSRLIGFSWWNEGWPNDDDPANDTNMRVQDNPPLAAVFKNQVGGAPNVMGNIPVNK
jgi:hypothetical protein